MGASPGLDRQRAMAGWRYPERGPANGQLVQDRGELLAVLAALQFGRQQAMACWALIPAG